MFTKPNYYNRNRSNDDDTRVNNMIRAPKIRLIDQDGNQVGVVDVRAGIERARAIELDLVEIAPNAEPPVCRIMDYGKYRYEQEQKKKVARKKQHIIQTKEVRFKPQIEENDYQVKIKHIKGFLEAKDKVRVSLRFRGREIAHKDHGIELFNKIANDVATLGELDSTPKMLGNTMMMTINPKR